MTAIFKWLACQFLHRWELRDIIDLGWPRGRRWLFWCPRCKRRISTW